MAFGQVARSLFDRLAGFDYLGNLPIRTGGDIGVTGRAYQVTGVVATDGTNKTKITMTVKDMDDDAVAVPYMMDVWLSDAASGAGLTSTTASGAVAAGAGGGADIGTLTAKKALRVQTTAAGVYELSITDTAKTAFKVCAQIPGRPPTVVATLATGDYG